jgi:RNA polymerase sigma-70 factor (ECF subfamily)
VLNAFLAAAQDGDMRTLAAVLAPDVVAIGDGGGVVRTALRPVLGADKVARFFTGLLTFRLAEVTDIKVDPVVVNGSAGMMLRGTWPDGSPLLVVSVVAVADGRITGIYNQQNPEKLILGSDF